MSETCLFSHSRRNQRHCPCLSHAYIGNRRGGMQACLLSDCDWFIGRRVQQLLQGLEAIQRQKKHQRCMTQCALGSLTVVHVERHHLSKFRRYGIPSFSTRAPPNAQMAANTKNISKRDCSARGPRFSGRNTPSRIAVSVVTKFIVPSGVMCRYERHISRIVSGTYLSKRSDNHETGTAGSCAAPKHMSSGSTGCHSGTLLVDSE